MRKKRRKEGKQVKMSLTLKCWWMFGWSLISRCRRSCQLLKGPPSMLDDMYTLFYVACRCIWIIFVLNRVYSSCRSVCMVQGESKLSYGKKKGQSCCFRLLPPVCLREVGGEASKDGPMVRDASKLPLKLEQRTVFKRDWNRDRDKDWNKGFCVWLVS